LRTYIKANVQMTYNTQEQGGIYLDSITMLRAYEGDRTVLSINGSSHAWVIVNKPLAEVEQLLADAQRERPKELDWRGITGKPQEPAKEPKAKKSLAARFGRG
jgi:hypothetical protein